jgi:hypothetical protein
VCADTGMLRIGGPLWWRIRHSELKNGPVMYRYGWDSSVDGWAETENICSGVGSNPVRGFFLSLMRLRVEYSIRTESVGWIFLCRRILFDVNFMDFFEIEELWRIRYFPVKVTERCGYRTLDDYMWTAILLRMTAFSRWCVIGQCPTPRRHKETCLVRTYSGFPKWI